MASYWHEENFTGKLNMQMSLFSVFDPCHSLDFPLYSILVYL